MDLKSPLNHPLIRHMRKVFVIPLIGSAVLLAIFLLLHSTLPITKTSKVSGHVPAGKPDNIDSLIGRIRKDKHYRIDGVAFVREDSTLLITIEGETASTRYFDTAYHLSTLRSIDRLLILNTNNRQLDAYSNKAVRLTAIFKAQWCSEDECTPLMARIKQDLAVTTYVRPIKQWIHWFADSTFIVTDSVQIINANGYTVTEKVSAQIDMHGTIHAYDNGR